jgi:hypothetical protein
LAASLLAWLLIAPLLLYTLALFVYFFHKVLGGGKSSAQVRMGLFWSFFAASPVMMLLGIVKGFLGSGTAENIIGFAWLVMLAYFIFSAVTRPQGRGVIR